MALLLVDRSPLLLQEFKNSRICNDQVSMRRILENTNLCQVLGYTNNISLSPPSLEKNWIASCGLSTPLQYSVSLVGYDRRPSHLITSWLSDVTKVTSS